MPDTHQPNLTRLSPPEAPLGSLALIRAIIRNPIEALPRAVFERPMVRSSVLGRGRRR